MKTIETTLQEHLVNHGLWPNEAEEVVAGWKNQEYNDSMQGRWNDSMDDYPMAIFSVLWASLRLEALEYLKKKNPNHFAIMILESQS